MNNPRSAIFGMLFLVTLLMIVLFGRFDPSPRDGERLNAELETFCPFRHSQRRLRVQFFKGG